MRRRIQRRDDRRERRDLGWFGLSMVGLMVFFYPMLTSIYGMFPPLIGVVGLMIIYTIDTNRPLALLGMLYLVNLDLNLGLPILLSLFSVVVIYLLVYPSAKLMIRCKRCLALFLIILVDAFYYVSLFIYDFIFSFKTIVADETLIFYILFDIFMGLFL